MHQDKSSSAPTFLSSLADILLDRFQISKCDNLPLFLSYHPRLYSTWIIDICSTSLITKTVTVTATCDTGCISRSIEITAGCRNTLIWYLACAIPSFAEVLSPASNIYRPTETSNSNNNISGLPTFNAFTVIRGRRWQSDEHTR